MSAEAIIVYRHVACNRLDFENKWHQLTMKGQQEIVSKNENSDVTLDRKQ